MKRFWERLSIRERRVRGCALIAVLLALAFVALPLERTRTRLAAQLPALRASVANLEREAAEVKRLRALPPHDASDASKQPPTLAADTLPELPGAHVARVDERRVRLTAPDVAFGPLLEWIEAAQAASGLRVERARIEALATPGRVRAELTLARS